MRDKQKLNVFFAPNHTEYISLGNLSLLEDHDNVN